MLSALESCFGQRIQSRLWCFLKLPKQCVCQAWERGLCCLLCSVYCSECQKLGWSKPELVFVFGFFFLFFLKYNLKLIANFNVLFFLTLSTPYLTFWNFNLIRIWNNMKKIIFKMIFGNICFHGTINRNHLSTFLIINISCWVNQCE